MRTQVRPWLLAGACALAGALTAAPTTSRAKALKPSPAPTPQAATTSAPRATLPLDYDHPTAPGPDRRRPRAGRRQAASGSLFFNFGGPGGTAVDYLAVVGASGSGAPSTSTSTSSASTRAASARARRRSTATPTRRSGASTRSPSPTPFNLDPGALIAQGHALHRQVPRRTTAAILAHVSTANVARDMDQIRAGSASAS